MRIVVPALCLAVAFMSTGCDGGELGPTFTGPTRETHGKYFPIARGSHAVDCNVCHGEFDTFTKFNCLNGCHARAETDAIHSGNGDYRYDSAWCFACHPQGVADGAVDHTRYFPIAAGDRHAGTACSRCHQDATTRANVTCTDGTCHTAPDGDHGGVGGYQATSSLCLRCHADSQVNRLAAHLPFRITGAFKHAGASCLVCHPARRTDKPFGEDFTPFDCYGGCHSRAGAIDTHQGFAGFNADDFTSCLKSGCHPNGMKPF